MGFSALIRYSDHSKLRLLGIEVLLHIINKKRLNNVITFKVVYRPDWYDLHISIRDRLDIIRFYKEEKMSSTLIKSKLKRTLKMMGMPCNPIK